MMRTAFVAWCGSVLLMFGALYFQYVEGLHPCVLCMYQRYPHYFVIVLGALALWRFPKAFPLLAIIVASSAAIAFFHVGVEQKWWDGLAICSGNIELTFEEMLNQTPARCDEIAWKFLGLSMAAWNGTISLICAALWVRASLKR